MDNEMANLTLNKKESHLELLNQAEKHLEDKEFSLALYAIRTSLAMKKTNQAEDMLRSLLKEMADQKNPNSIEFSLTGMDPSNPLQKRIECAKRLNFIAKEESILRSVSTKENINFFINLCATEEDEQLRHEILFIIARIAVLPEFSDLILEELAKDDVASHVLSFNTDKNMELGTDILAITLGHFASSPEFTLDKIQKLLGVLYSRCLYQGKIEIQLAAYKGLIKALANEDMVLDFFKPQNLMILMNLYEKSHDQRSIAVALLASCLSHVSNNNASKVTEIFYQAIDHLLRSDQQAIGLLALSNLFQASPRFGGNILNKEGFLESILDIIEFETEEIQFYTIETLSSACNINELRKLVAERSVPFLLKSLNSKSERVKGVSSLALVKLMPTNPDIQKELLNESNFNSLFTNVLNSKNESKNKLLAVEALAYLTVKPKVKEIVANNPGLIQNLKALLSTSDRSCLYGATLIFYNLSAYLEPLTEEEKQAQKLQQMAKAIPEADPLDDKEYVQKRITLLAAQNIIPALSKIQSDSENVHQALAGTLNNIASSKEYRGALVQGGACRILLKIANTNTGASSTATHALAKIAISTNPNLAFKGQMASELIRPFLKLVTESEKGLVKFETLLALTNLAGMNDEVRNRIIALNGQSSLENLQFSDHPLIRRAATECLCNLIFHPVVFSSYLSAKSKNSLMIMMALSDEDDFATRRAASGAIAILSSEKEAVPLILEHKRAFEIFLHLLESKNDELIHRSCSIIRNIVDVPKYGNEIPKDILKYLKIYSSHANPSISACCIETLQVLNKIGIQL